MKKISKIHVGREFYLSWSSNSFVVGRPRSKRHLTIMVDRRRLAAHLTDETFPERHPSRHKHLGAIQFDALESLDRRWKAAGVDAFIDGLVPVDAAVLTELDFRLAAAKDYGLEYARTFLKPRLRPVLSIREPSSRALANFERRFVDALVDPSHLDSMRDQPPGSVSAVWLEEGQVIGAFQLFFYPNGAFRSDGTALDPGWYAQLHPEYVHSAQARVLLEFVGPKFFSKVDRALQFLGFESHISDLEMEDAFRRLADGETIEQVRARRTE